MSSNGEAVEIFQPVVKLRKYLNRAMDADSTRGLYRHAFEAGKRRVDDADRFYVDHHSDDYKIYRAANPLGVKAYRAR